MYCVYVDQYPYLPADAAREVLNNESVFRPGWWSIPDRMHISHTYTLVALYTTRTHTNNTHTHTVDRWFADLLSEPHRFTSAGEQGEHESPLTTLFMH